MNRLSAAYQSPGFSINAMKARVQLLVTVPRSITWDQPEVGR